MSNLKFEEVFDGQVEVNAPQGAFLALDRKFKAFVAGFGSGKTWVGCMAQCMHYREFPGVNQGYFAPTYSQIRDIYYPTIAEVAHSFGMTTRIHTTNKEVHFSVNGREVGTTLCRSMNDPASIVGFRIGRAMVDELDTLPTDRALLAWRKIIARMRYKVDGVKNGIDVTTTPEGFKFVYQQFHGNESPHYGIVQASTLDNEVNLPDDYIDSLIDSYPAELISAYLNGQFTNLVSGTVYRNYSREKCYSGEVIREGEPLFIGQDFNVGAMASVVYVKREKEWHAVYELTDGIDTPATCHTIKQKWPENKIYMYPDASGGSRSSTDASTSDLAIIRKSGISIRVRPSNPFVKDRVLSMNTAFDKGLVKVNPALCPEYTQCLEQQAYNKNGEPDKTTGQDHLCFHGDQMVVVNGVSTRFRDIPAVGKVLCADGVEREYVDGGLIKNGAMMLEVTLSTGYTVRCTPDHQFLTLDGWCEASQLSGKKLCSQSSLAPLFRNTGVSGITSAGSISRIGMADSIAKYGSMLTENIQRAITSIIKAKTDQKICWRIFSFCLPQSTCATTGRASPELCRLKPLRRLRNGTPRLLARSGTVSSMIGPSTCCMGLSSHLFVSNVASGQYQSKKRLNFVLKNARHNIAGCLAWMMSSAPVLSAVASLLLTSTRKISIVRENVAALPTAADASQESRQELASSVARYLVSLPPSEKKRALALAPVVTRTESIQPADAYCLTVSGYGMFMVAGVVTSNCDAGGYPIVYELPVNRPVIQSRKLPGIYH